MKHKKTSLDSVGTPDLEGKWRTIADWYPPRGKERKAIDNRLSVTLDNDLVGALNDIDKEKVKTVVNEALRQFVLNTAK